MLATFNFEFLSVHDTQLVRLGVLAERCPRDAPATAIFRLLQFAELPCKRVAANHALYLGDRETFEDTLRRLSSERIIPMRQAARDARPRSMRKTRRSSCH